MTLSYIFLKEGYSRLCVILKNGLLKSNVDVVNSSRNPKLFWQTINGLSNKHVNNYNLWFDSDTWHNYFKGLFNRETGDVVDGASIFDNLTREVNADELNLPISKKAIRYSILARHGNRATVTDGLCIEMYKCT